MIHQIIPISVDYGKYQLKGDIFHSEKIDTKLVFLHGAGLGTRDRYKEFRTSLLKVSIGSLAFDFIGFGDTGGDISESSLKGRTEQACAVIDAVGINTPFYLLGSSMGAYTAIKLSIIYCITSLILFVPAVYDIDAYPVPFGDRFTTIIRRRNSWINSDAWKILNDYKGSLLIVAAGKDDIIPRDAIHRIYDAATSASKREIITVEDSPHLLIHYLSQNRKEFENVLEKVRQNIS